MIRKFVGNCADAGLPAVKAATFADEMAGSGLPGLGEIRALIDDRR